MISETISKILFSLVVFLYCFKIIYRQVISGKRLSMLDTDGCRYCDRCGVKLTPDNNKNGFELCDRCDKQLHEELKADREKREKERMGC